MYSLTDKQIEYILNDIRRNGVEMEDLQLNLLDHICCIVEENLEANGDFESFYARTIKTFYKKQLSEIEAETLYLLTFKNYYHMKKAMLVTGAVSVTSLIFGSFFKIMHWPGANILLLFGIVLLSFVFLPLMTILKTRDTSTKLDKVVMALGSLTGMLLSLAMLGSLLHWNIRTPLWLTTVSFSMFVFIPVYFFSGIRKPEAKLNTIVISILLVGATLLQFTMIRVRPLPPTQMYTYIHNELLLRKMQQHADKDTAHQFQPGLAVEINQKCNLIKGILLKHEIGSAAIPETLDYKNIKIEERSLNNDFFDAGGEKQLKELKISVAKYNTAAKAPGTAIPVEYTILDPEKDNMNYFTNLEILNNLTQVQMYLATAQNTPLATLK